MAAPYNPPVKNEDFVIHIGLEDSASPGHYKANPTIASGDFKVSKDGGALNNLTTLPSVEPSGSVMVRIELSSTEMNADEVTILGIDAAGAEWNDFMLSIPTTQ
jgi:hypothetical protein